MPLPELLIMLSELRHRPANANELEAITEIAHVVDLEHPIFGDVVTDEAVMLVQADRESSFRKHAIGDGGHSFGLYQIQHVPLRILNDVRAQTEIAYARLRASAEQCRDAPLAIYTSGSCTNRGGRKQSRARMAEVQRIRERLREMADNRVAEEK